MTVVGGLIVGIALDKVRINKRTITISMTSKIYVSPYDSGSFVFDYSNNNGTYIIGLQERGFTTKWSKASDTSKTEFGCNCSIMERCGIFNIIVINSSTIIKIILLK